MGDLCIWAGPVATANLTPAKWRRPTAVYTVQGNGSDYFAGLGRSLAPGIVGKLIAKWQHQVPGVRPAPDAVALCSFSAGHGLVELACREPASLAQLSAIGAFDSYYVGKQGDIKPGYQAACERAAAGQMLMVLTTGASGGLLPSGVPFPSARDAFRPLAEKLGMRAVKWPGAAHVPEPDEIYQRGALLWLDYGKRFKHEQHATVIAPAVCSDLIAPRMSGAAGTGGADDSALFVALAALALAAL